MPNTEFHKRVITGLCIGLVIIGCTLGGRLSSYLLVLVIVIGSCLEYLKLSGQNSGTALSNRIGLTCLLPIIIAIAVTINIESVLIHIDWGIFAITMYMVVVLNFLFHLKTDVKSIAQSLRIVGLGCILFTLPGAVALELSSHNPEILLGIFILLWSNDVFAYFGGKSFGKHLLLPSISPKKTWEGFFSGLIMTSIAAWGISFLFIEVERMDWIVFAVFVVVFGTLGDFLQSAMKREAGVKDSGNILPGHGGMWDRFDSFLGCIPWVGAYHLLT